MESLLAIDELAAAKNARDQSEPVLHSTTKISVGQVAEFESENESGKAFVGCPRTRRKDSASFIPGYGTQADRLRAQTVHRQEQ
jgi:hypothetical protein